MKAILYKDSRQPLWLLDYVLTKYFSILDTADGTPTREYDIPVLSGSAFIGQLYDATKDQLLMDRYLWQLPIVVNEANITSVKTKMFLEEKITDRYDHLDVSASISASLYSGLIEVSLDFEWNNIESQSLQWLKYLNYTQSSVMPEGENIFGG